MTECLNVSCQGESHKATQKPCQDYSLSLVADDGVAVAVVCDGHGGDRYFRSQWGAQFAAQITQEAVLDLVRQSDAGLFLGQPYTVWGPIEQGRAQGKSSSREFAAFRQLFTYIIYSWREKIQEHAAKNPLNDWELQHVKQPYLDDFSAGHQLEKTYGCTLMAYAQTPQYWLAFHIGDGKMIAYNEAARWCEPVPWDDRCFLNKTTSLCDDDALNEFRYAYEGDGHFPVAVFLGSDGLDDSFGEETNLVNFYIQIIKMLAADGKEATCLSLQKDLPCLSQRGSKDDMSIAAVFSTEALQQNVHRFVEWQRDFAADRLDAADVRLRELADREQALWSSPQVAELTALRRDLAAAQEEHDHMTNRIAERTRRCFERHFSLLAERLSKNFERTKRMRRREKELVGSKPVIELDMTHKDLVRAQAVRSDWEKKLGLLKDEINKLTASPTPEPALSVEESKVPSPPEPVALLTEEKPTLPSRGEAQEPVDVTPEPPQVEEKEVHPREIKIE